MSAQPDLPAQDLVTIEIDGKSLQARKGAMIIEVADEAGIEIPRFCYHKKLSVAANCRMCMVEVEKVPKPLPACATPVAEGMKVFTKSAIATGAQKAVMEFLLINHPLDCPICDQGGECELQDLALGYGRDVSRFAENKRVVEDKYIGPLIATDMTRCIHCTRCIRVLREIAGKMELGATGRGENMRIGTYIEVSLESELSGNVIDVCPVGALTSRPFRFKARAWELNQTAAVAPHDSVGSNIFVHARRGQVMRVVPRENEEINEVWLSDRDRFSYQGLYADDRLATPMIKVNGQWQETDWDGALQAAVDGLRSVAEEHGGGQLGLLVSPVATLEEMYLAQAVARGLGTNNIDHRLRQGDFTGQDNAPLSPVLGQSLQALESLDAALVIGANPRKDQPLIAHRLRKAALAGARVMFVNPVDYEFHLPVHAKAIVAPSRMAAVLAGVAACFPDATADAPASVRRLIDEARPDEAQRAMAEALRGAGNRTLLLGNTATAHPQYSLLAALAVVIADASGAVLGHLPEAANSVGGWLAGVLPHRGPAGASLSAPGLNAREMLDSPRKAYLLVGIEPEHDCWDAGSASRALAGADFVVALSPWAGKSLKACANVLLPTAPCTETSGTFVNAEGRWQSFAGAASPYAGSRPGWKVLRVLGNRLGLEGFDYASSEEVRDQLHRHLEGVAVADRRGSGPVAEPPTAGQSLERIGDVAIHGADALVRRAVALQKSPDALVTASARLCAAQAAQSGVSGASSIKITQGGENITVPLVIDERVPVGCLWLPAGTPATAGFGPNFGPIGIEAA
jgi:NADH-quinone oxidoreductase subunit G